VLSPGQIRFLPLTFSLPETVLPTSGDADGVIELTVTRRPDNEPVATDTFAFRAYRKQSPDKDLLSARIALYDPAGESGALFTRLGLTPAMIADPARTPADAGLLVIGRRALATLDTAWLSSLPPSLPPALPVLFLEQTDADLERLGFRAYPARPRAVFTLPGGSSLLPPDLRDPELANWNVCPTLLPAGSAPLRDGYNFTNGYQGALASVTIETPTLGNFTPHLQTGFDLRETPLLETTLSGRRLVFCQLSLPEAVGADPVATRIAASLLRNLVAKPGHASTAKRIPLVVTGDERLAALARDLGAAASPVTIFQGQFNDAPAPVPGVALLDGIPEDSRESAALRAWIRGGGRALVLPGSTGSTGSGISSLRRVFPEAPASIDKTITSLAPPPVATTPEAAAFLRGIGQNNLHARQALPVLRFGGGDGDGDGGAPVSVFGVGDGHIVLLGFDPRQIDTTRTPWLKLTRAHQYRVLSQLLTNLGADLSAPASALFAPGAPSRRIEIGDDARARQTRATGADTTDASWTKPGFDDSAWGRFDLKNQKTPDGHALLRIAFRTPATLPPGPLFLDLGTVDDFDETWLNGVKIGATTPANTNPDTAWTVHRLYPVPGDILKTDADTVNVIAIRLWNRNAAAKGWPAWLRGPVSIHPVAPGSSGAPLYIGEHRRVDDPYLQYHW
jgi:hypothetical protein